MNMLLPVNPSFLLNYILQKKKKNMLKQNWYKTIKDIQRHRDTMANNRDILAHVYVEHNSHVAVVGETTSSIHSIHPSYNLLPL